ncbi:MAG TPA: cytochrome c biogenesis protein CcdA [Candidatus Xenobia bacterium]|jgi:thiol:disulfide interchange protein DsbD
MFLVLVAAMPALALPKPPQVLTVTVQPSTDAVHPHDSVTLAVILEIGSAYHIQAHVPSSSDYIPTVVTTTPTADVTYPPAKSLKLPYEDQPLQVYSGHTVILAHLLAPDSPGPMHVTGTISYQGCTEQSCFPPATQPFSVDIPVVAAGAAVHPVHPELFPAALPSVTASPATDATPEKNSLADTIQQRGWLIALAVIFVQGLALNLTPCVYPLIPITISFFGSQSVDDPDPVRQRTRTFLLASTYVLGMCTTYSILGVFAALTGHLFGSALQSPWVLGFVAVTFFALSLSMMGVYELTVPSSIASRVESKKGVWGALFMGLFIGIVAAPCIGPFVLSLFTMVGQSGNPVLGFWLFFTMALGLGTPFLILGWFSGSTKALPRSGAWMVWVKKVLGLIMMGIAIWYLKGLLPERLWVWLLPAFAVAAGIYAGFLEKTQPGRQPGFLYVKRAVGVAFVLAGIGLGAQAWQQINAVGAEWEAYSPSLVVPGKPIVIDFGAGWCTDCHELETKTYTDKRVISALSSFVRLKADLTNDNDPTVKALYKQYDIQGLPTVVFLAPDGHELKNLRLTGFENPDAFVERVSQDHG